MYSTEIVSLYAAVNIYSPFVAQYDQMKSLFKKTKEIQARMMHKVKDALLQRNDMQAQMEEAFAAKAAVSTVINVLSVTLCNLMCASFLLYI